MVEPEHTHVVSPPIAVIFMGFEAVPLIMARALALPVGLAHKSYMSSTCGVLYPGERPPRRSRQGILPDLSNLH
jgi:hypothetical protein